MARVVDLDELALERTVLKLGGEEYEITEPKVDQFVEIQEIVRETNLDTADVQGLTEKQVEGLKRSFCLMIDGFEDVAGDLTLTQLLVLQRVLADYMQLDEDKLQRALEEDDQGE